MDAARRIFDLATIALFLLALLAPAADQCLRPDGARDCLEAEQRNPEPRPPLPRDLNELAIFPRRYENHYNDTFGLRDVLLRWNSIEKWLYLGVSPATSHDLGAPGWCFYTGQDSRATHRGVQPFRERDLDDWVRRLRERRDYLAAHGARYLFVICPNKETIYPEFAPPSWKPVGPTRLDQLAARLEQEGDLPFLDLRPALRAAKAQDRPGDWLYTALGTHWDGRGTYAAYQAILTRLQQDFPELSCLPRSALEWVVSDGSGEGLARRAYVEDLVPITVRGPRPRTGQGYKELLHRQVKITGAELVTSKPIDAPRLLWVHDSFGPYLQPLVCESFSYVQARAEPELSVEWLSEARPDVVLETYVERVLTGPAYQATAPRSAPLDEQFDGLADVLWSARPGAGFPAAESFGGARVEQGENGIHLTRIGLRDGLMLPALEAEKDSLLLLRVSATSAEPIEIDVTLRLKGEAVFLPRNGTGLHLGPEQRSAVVRLPLVGSPFETLLRPHPPASEITLETLEIRRGTVQER